MVTKPIKKPIVINIEGDLNADWPKYIAQGVYKQRDVEATDRAAKDHQKQSKEQS